MRKLLLVLLTVTSLGASAQNYEWAKNIGGTGEDRANVIKVDASGNIFVAGAFSGTADFDPGAGTYNLVSVGDFDLYVAKYDASGNFLWAQRDGNIYDDFVLDMDVDPSGNVYITGYGEINTSGSNRAMIVGKIDPSGTTQWAYTFITAETVAIGGYALTVDATGNVFVGGSFTDSVDFDPGPATNYLTATPGSVDAYILKFNTGGDFQWVKQFECGGNASTDYITLDALGNIYSTGNFWNAGIDCDPGAGSAILSNNGNADIFISKLDVNGDYVWAKSMGSSALDYGLSIAVGATGNVYSTGFFEGTVDFDPGAGTQNLTSEGMRDVFISKLDANGDYLWAKGMGSSTANDIAKGIDIDVSGNIYTTGYFEGTVDFDPGAGTTNIVSTGDKDAFVQKLDNNGDFVWAHHYGSTVEDHGISIALDASNNIYMAGHFNGTADFDFSLGTSNLTTAGSRDAYFTKWSQSAVGIGENLLSENALYLYPNPAIAQITIANLELSIVNVTILDAIGKVVKTQKPTNNTINISNLISGVYFLQVQTDSGISTQRFIKE
jgi:hypothetical protein